MSSTIRRKKEKEVMKSTILEAAIKIIIEEGYDKLSMRKIANVIDYTPTTIYSYYKDKAQIIDDISKQISDNVINNVKVALEENKEDSPEQQLILAFKVFLYSITDNAQMGKAVMQSGTRAIFSSNDEPISPENNGVLILSHILTDGQKQGLLRKVDNNTPWMLITALIGFAMNALENHLYLNENWHELVNTYTEMLVKGLLP